MQCKDRISIILNLLDQHYPNANCELNYSTPLELLIATILSAQCTDKMVCRVTESLFKKYKNLDDYCQASQQELEKDIYSTGFYKNKAKYILETCHLIKTKFNGRVPNNMNQLLQLSGVARKTANVVLGTVFGISEGIVVDTHVLRISNRLGLIQTQNATRAEQQLIQLIPKAQWIILSHQLIHHGRSLCQSMTPKCKSCFLKIHCPFFQATVLST